MYIYISISVYIYMSIYYYIDKPHFVAIGSQGVVQEVAIQSPEQTQKSNSQKTISRKNLSQEYHKAHLEKGITEQAHKTNSHNKLT